MSIVIQSKSSSRYAVEGRTFTSNIDEARQFSSEDEARQFILTDLAKGRQAEYDNQAVGMWIVVNGKKMTADPNSQMRLNPDGPSGYGW